MALKTVARPGTRAFNDAIDEQARDIVRAYFAASASQDEAELRRHLAELLAKAQVPHEVAVQYVRSQGHPSDYITDLEGRLQVYLVRDVNEKLDLERLLSSSLCGWARQLLLRQAWTAYRSECNSRRAVPVVDISLPGPPSRPGKHPSRGVARPETSETLEDELSEEFVVMARRACHRENEVHLVEYLLRQKYGFHPPVRVALSVTPFGDIASRLLQRRLKEDCDVLSRQATEAVLSSARALRHAPSKAVAERFLDLVAEAVEDEAVVGPLAQAWLAKWVEVKTVGLPKTDHERSEDASTWLRVAEAAVEEGLLGARNVERLAEALEKLFWQAHYRAAASRLRVA
jgi:hypothetical protein